MLALGWVITSADAAVGEGRFDMSGASSSLDFDLGEGWHISNPEKGLNTFQRVVASLGSPGAQEELLSRQ